MVEPAMQGADLLFRSDETISKCLTLVPGLTIDNCTHKPVEHPSETIGESLSRPDTLMISAQPAL